MKSLYRALGFSAIVTLTAMTAVTAQASASAAPIVMPAKVALESVPAKPAVQTPFASASRPEDAKHMEVALLQNGCSDPDPWYQFSGIQALTCLLSGQW
ncbi:hypothetical protein M2262_002806 [Pseudomonas sp. BIGb0408]|uniref:Uncharacterized protein n=1 Tax=Phytopseudomonas flavescens TaxID=29435 RepID=A0A7Y9XM65_9GAMM|nr:MULTISPECIES: hypothetical protein [Pseudomonas]MCW2292756.1 hypothetical protein [Pseudomonas sp. BIGb0408]NYH72674.1 hypothetical protein [Pseudomonas flavescens]